MTNCLLSEGFLLVCMHANCDLKVADLGEGSRGRILGKKKEETAGQAEVLFFIFIVDY